MTVLLSNSREGFQKMISNLLRSLKAGLKMKTNLMYNNNLVGQQVMTGNEAKELVKDYTYLRQVVSANIAHGKKSEGE